MMQIQKNTNTQQRIIIMINEAIADAVGESYTSKHFVEHIAYRPLCTNDFNSEGLFKRVKHEALTHQYIQHNDDAFVSSLVFDIDRSMGAISWDFVGLPRPNIITQNTQNGHAHLLYALRHPVCKTDAARLKPLSYLARIERGMRDRLEADRAYTGLITKNPLNTHWRTIWGDNEPYELSYLRDFLDEDLSFEKQIDYNYGLGRNVSLFNELRKIGYSKVLHYKKDDMYDNFYKFLLREAYILNLRHNQNNLLMETEILNIVKSICRWTWKNFSQKKFSKIQSARAKKTRKTTIDRLKLIQLLDNQ